MQAKDSNVSHVCVDVELQLRNLSLFWLKNKGLKWNGSDLELWLVYYMVICTSPEKFMGQKYAHLFCRNIFIEEIGWT